MSSHLKRSAQADRPGAHRRGNKRLFVSFERASDYDDHGSAHASTSALRSEHTITTLTSSGLRLQKSSAVAAPIISSLPSAPVIPATSSHDPTTVTVDDFNFSMIEDNLRNSITEPQEHAYAFASFRAAFEEEFPPETQDGLAEPTGKKKRVRELANDPMLRWIRDDRATFLMEFIRLEGRGAFSTQDSCSLCSSTSTSLFRCHDCLPGDQLICTTCMLGRHQRLPFHRIERWTGSFFEQASLKKLGLRIQLGHPRGDRCMNPRRSANDDFVIIDSSGVHEVNLDFCACQIDTPKDPAIQLLRASLYPSTTTNPQSAATFSALKFFHLLSFESKINGNEFIHAVERLTCNTDIHEPRDRYEQFLRMIHQWRHLKQLKRAGRGHDVTGIEGTQPGECALLCPACPHPGKNLPDNWKSAPKEMQYIYALFIGADGNFHLTRKKVSSDEKDPGLNQGYAFVVEEVAYKGYIAKNWDYKQERSTCVNHSAVNDANKEARGLAASGATTIDCIRHDFKRPCGVGDFQKGERYINTDYVLFSSLKDTECTQVCGSYDIACQYMKNITLREQMLPEHLHWSKSIEKLTFFVPKFHIAAHEENCNLEFSFNLTRGVGRTDGEAPERGWSNINAIATSTKEMGPGARRDTLDDHFNDWNWKKIIKLSESLLSKIKKALPEREKQIDVHADFEQSVGIHIDISPWRAAVEAWEEDRRNPNPYRSTVKKKSERAVRLQLTQESAKTLDADLARERVENGITSVAGSEVDAPSMIAMGLDLEDAQRQLAKDAASLSVEKATSKQLTEVIDQSNKLRRRIATWIDIQAVHMPEAILERERNMKVAVEGIPGVSAHNIPLCLPSGMAKRASIKSCWIEYQLRDGQSADALENVRHHLRLRSHLYSFKDKYSRGVKQNTRSVAAVKKCQDKVDEASFKYNRACNAMLKLGEVLWPDDRDGGWKKKIRLIEPGDARGLHQGKSGESEGNRTMSWIWRSEGIVDGAQPSDYMKDPGIHDSLRIEWCRSRARAMRWAEEVVLLEEELRRSSQYCAWKAQWWLVRGRDILADDETKEGLKAYAAEQANVWLTLGERCGAAYKAGLAAISAYTAVPAVPTVTGKGKGPDTEGAANMDTQL